MDYLTHTPRWVFGLLLALCIFGSLQARTRQVRPGLALLLPVAMLILSIAGVLQYTSHWPAGLASWLIGLAVSATLVSRVMSAGFVTLDTHSGQLSMQGSWVPLLVILGIFLTRYALGVANALHFPALGHWLIQMLVAGVLGLWSGYFAFRGWVCWRVIRSAQRLSSSSLV